MLARLKWLAAACMIAIAVMVGTGCSSENDSLGAAAQQEVVISAASSLKQAFSEYGAQFDAARVKASFAGSDELAAQIEQGVRPDVIAAANTKIPEQLYAKGLVEKPVVFAGNRLVIAVQAGSEKVGSLDDLDVAGVTIAAGSESVPIGTYTRKVLDGLPTAERATILKNFRSNEHDVKGIVGKVATGSVDAGFVYVTDVEASSGELKAIELPKKLQPSVAYGVAVVKDAKHPELAQQFVDGLLSGKGQRALASAGFEPPPS